MQKYVDDDGDEINESEFRDSFSKGAGGSWDFDGEHGGDFSVKISPTPVAKSDEFDAGTVMISLGGLRPGTVAPRSPGSSKRTRSNFGATLAKRSKMQTAVVAYKLTLRSPAVERYVNDDPYCDHLDEIFGELAAFFDGKEVVGPTLTRLTEADLREIGCDMLLPRATSTDSSWRSSRDRWPGPQRTALAAEAAGESASWGARKGPRQNKQKNDPRVSRIRPRNDPRSTPRQPPDDPRKTPERPPEPPQTRAGLPCHQKAHNRNGQTQGDRGCSTGCADDSVFRSP